MGRVFINRVQFVFFFFYISFIGIGNVKVGNAVEVKQRPLSEELRKKFHGYWFHRGRAGGLQKLPEKELLEWAKSTFYRAPDVRSCCVVLEV